MNNKEILSGTRIAKNAEAVIPDDDMPGWIRALSETGFTEEEMDLILGHLNETYAEQKGIIDTERELRKIEQYILEKERRTLTDEQRDYLRKGIEMRKNK